MRMRNRSGNQVTVRGLGLVVPPGGTCEVADGYCRPQLAANGSRLPSIIESVAPQLVPDDPADEAEWRKTPKPLAAPVPTPQDIAKKLEAEGLPPAVAAIAAAGPPEPKQRRGRKAEA